MDILEKIIRDKRREVEYLNARFSKKSFEDQEFFHRENVSFIKKIQKGTDIKLIAEVKKASPSKGIIRENFDHIKIAKEYIKSNADAISVLTDEKYFQGNLKFLKDIAEVKSVPLLRKDFIIDEIQIYEAKAAGADLILLIAEVLSMQEIKDLTVAADSLGLEVLLELHSTDQIDKIDFELNRLIGVNNRNLKTFSTDINNTFEIASELPDNIFLVSESGINGKQELEKLKALENCAGVLVGEYFMRQTDIAESVRKFKAWC